MEGLNERSSLGIATSTNINTGCLHCIACLSYAFKDYTKKGNELCLISKVLHCLFHTKLKVYKADNAI